MLEYSQFIKNYSNNEFDIFSLSSISDHANLFHTADFFLNSKIDKTNLAGIYNDNSNPLHFRIAARAALSKLLLTEVLKELAEPLHLYIITDLTQGEENRIRLPSEDNPSGEACFYSKIRELEWITQDVPNKLKSKLEWRLVHVASQSEGSNVQKDELLEQLKLLPRILKQRVHILDAKSHLFYEGQALAAKGGDIRQGIEYALNIADENKINNDSFAIWMTDFDKSVNLALEIGFHFFHAYFENSFFSIGNRKRSDSILIKNSSRWGGGVGLLRHIVRSLFAEFPQSVLYDTQCPDKMIFGIDRIQSIIQDQSDIIGWAFDPYWIWTGLQNPKYYNLRTKPVVFIDSENHSYSKMIGPEKVWYDLVSGAVMLIEEKKSKSDQSVLLLTKELLLNQNLTIAERNIRIEKILKSDISKEFPHYRDQDFGNSKKIPPQKLERVLSEIIAT